MYDIFHDGAYLQFFHSQQIVAFQVFDRKMINVDGEIGGDVQPSDANVGTGFLRNVSPSDSDGKLLNDRVLDGHKDAHDERNEHHDDHEDAMDNLFFNNFEPPNLSP